MLSTGKNIATKTAGVALSASLFFASSAFAADERPAGPQFSSDFTVTVSLSEDGSVVADAMSHVHKHIVFVVDVSDTVDEDEYQLLTDGIKQAILNSNASYREGFAFTTIRFASASKIGTTHIVYSENDAFRYIDAEFGDVSKHAPNEDYKLGYGTNIESGVDAVDRLLTAQESVLGITSEQTAVIFIGDGQPNEGRKDLQRDISLLAQKFGATSYAVPIRDNAYARDQTESARRFYQANLVTPAGFKYKNERVFGDFWFGVAQGTFEPAENFSDVQESVTSILKLGPS